MTAQIIPVDPDNARSLARHATEIRRLGKQVVSDVIEIGRLLVESKELVGHGDWLPWLSREFHWSDKTAERLMQVHKLSLKNDNLSNLAIPLSGLYELAKPSTPETAKQEVISRAEAGEPMTVNTIKEIVGRANAVPATPAEGTRKKPLPRLLKDGTVVEADFKHLRFFRGGFVRRPIRHITDCGGNYERRDDGHYDYAIDVTAVISGEHLKWFSKADTRPADDDAKDHDRGGRTLPGEIHVRLSPEQVVAIDE
jgi:hypothetical protein